MSQSYEERMAIIKQAAAKFNATLKRSHDVRKSETSYIDKHDDGNNINAYTDPEKYVDEYYGDRARAVTSYDNEWN